MQSTVKSIHLWRTTPTAVPHSMEATISTTALAVSSRGALLSAKSLSRFPAPTDLWSGFHCKIGGRPSFPQTTQSVTDTQLQLQHQKTHLPIQSQVSLQVP